MRFLGEVSRIPINSPDFDKITTFFVRFFFHILILGKWVRRLVLCKFVEKFVGS